MDGAGDRRGGRALADGRAPGKLPWIGLVLGLTFGAYGLLRKIAVLGALEGLTFETMILAPAAVAGMAWWWGGSPTSFPAPDLGTNLWLLGLGPATTAAAAAVRLRRAPDLADDARPDAVPRARRSSSCSASGCSTSRSRRTG